MEQVIQFVQIFCLAIAVIGSPFLLWLLVGAADNWIEDHA